MLNKKYIAFIFLTIFLFSNIGWSINVHYCEGDSFSNLSYIHDTKHQCMMADEEPEPMPCCDEPAAKEDLHQGHDKSEDCCKDEVIKSSVTDQSISKTFPIQMEALCPDTTWTKITKPSFEAIVLKQQALDYYVESNAPPLFKLYCRLVLYA